MTGRVSGQLLSANLLRNGEDLAFNTELLYIDVNNGRIGVNTIAPSRTLTVAGTLKTDYLIVDFQKDVAALTIIDNKIQNPTGIIVISPNQTTNPIVKGQEFHTQNLSFTTNTITNFVNNDDITITANGDGHVIFNTNEKLYIDGNLHATGSITWDGTITFGTADDDSVSFLADITSNITPDVNNLYDIGSLSEYWKKLYSVNVDTTEVVTTEITANNINLLLTQGKTYYVATTGNDVYSSASYNYKGTYNNATNYQLGDKVLFNGLYYKRITDSGTSGFDPTDLVRWVVTTVSTNTGTHQHSPFRTVKKALSVAQAGDEVVIFPGVYLEEFPLTVPAGVSVRGMSLRAVTISPTPATNTNDAFLLNGETTVLNLTVKDFFYDINANTGYAFRFAPGMLITVKSPYIQNCTVITSGPNAGSGALIDGNDANPASNHLSMLFYAVTMFTPGTDGIVAKNNVRVEWLNSFTYYAYRGIFLDEGILGGAELRSINSANYYGTYGVYGDGASCIAYLVGHSFGFIGAGTDISNDRTLAIQANEVVAINGATVLYESQDHKGDFRIGDIFYINQETGQVSFDATAINFNSAGGIVFEGEDGVTSIDPYAVQTGNIQFRDNTIESLNGPVNLFASSSTTYLNTNVTVTGSTTISNDTSVHGNVFIGNDVFDVVSIIPNLTQHIKPNANNAFTLGHRTPDQKVWRTLFLTTLNVDAVSQLTNNTISTLTSDTDLKLIAAGDGEIHVASTDVAINDNLTIIGTTTVDGVTSLKNVETEGTITLVGDINQTGNTDITGTFANNNIKITGLTSYFEVPNIKIVTNKIQETLTNSDITFTGNGAGAVVLDSKLKITDTEISNRWTGATTDTQKSILFSPNGLGSTVISTTKFLTLPYSNNSTKVLSNLGEVRQNSTTGFYEGFLTNGLASFTNLYDTDRNTYITPELTHGANDGVLRFGINNVVNVTINSTKLSSVLTYVDNISLTNNTIHNLALDTDLEFHPAGVGNTNLNGIKIQNSTIKNDLNSAMTLVTTGTGYIKFGGVAGIVIPYGDSSGRRSTPELGETRYNSQLGYLEVFNDVTWIPAVGEAGSATVDEVDAILNFMSLIFG